jgi:O-antigen/teichoic acid export membrane protein
MTSRRRSEPGRERRRDRIAGSSTDTLRPDRPADQDDEVVYQPDPLDEQEITPPNAEPHKIKRLPGAKQVKKNTLEALVFRALATPLAFGLTVLQARALNTEGTGEYTLAVLTVLLFSRLLSDLGNAATREIGEHTDRVGPVTALALRLCVVFAPIGFLAVILLSQFPGLIGEKESIDFKLALLAAVALGPNIVRQTMSGILVGMGRIRLWSYLQIAPSVLAFIAFWIFVGIDARFTIPLVDEEVDVHVGIFDLGVEGAILGWALGHLITASVSLVLTRSIWLPHLTARIPRDMTFALIRMALAMGAVNVILLLNYRIEFILIERFTESSELAKERVGQYKVATQIAEALWLITTALATATWTTMLHEREDRAAATVLRSCIRGLLFLTAAAVGLGVIVWLALPSIFGEDFKPSISPTLWLLPGIVLYGPVALLSPYISVRHRRPRLALFGPVLSILVTAGLAYPLIEEYGIDGAAGAASVGYVVSALVTWVMFAKLAGFNWRGQVTPATA